MTKKARLWLYEFKKKFRFFTWVYYILKETNYTLLIIIYVSILRKVHLNMYAQKPHCTLSAANEILKSVNPQKL